MVDPSPFPDRAKAELKRKLRAKMRVTRREYVADLPDATRALLFLRPPAPIAALAPEDTAVGLYHALPVEAPTRSYAKWFYENGRTIALPRFESRDSPMRFHIWRDPYEDGDLEPGPFNFPQPASDAPEVTPALVLVPLLAFSPACDRLGQGGGHYDRWLDENREVLPIGLAWDCQCVDLLPVEPHDRKLEAVVTPTRYYEGSE
ncbi:MAG: 5-formyltetrahydrofolate cyclo-ligase [Novosphingobium sp.]